jgi:hypothetical protein
MEGVHYELDTEAQFWAEVDDILSSPSSEVSVETTVRNFVRFAAAFRGTTLPKTVVNDSGVFKYG